MSHEVSRIFTFFQIQKLYPKALDSEIGYTVLYCANIDRTESQLSYNDIHVVQDNNIQTIQVIKGDRLLL